MTRCRETSLAGCGAPEAPNGLELSCPAEAGRLPLIVAHVCGPGAPPYAPARRVSFSEVLGGAIGGDRSYRSAIPSIHASAPSGRLSAPEAT
jgi:hypothetical protein